MWCGILRYGIVTTGCEACAVLADCECRTLCSSVFGAQRPAQNGRENPYLTSQWIEENSAHRPDDCSGTNASLEVRLYTPAADSRKW